MRSLVLLLCVLLAGCSEVEPAASTDEDANFDDVELESDTETGVIRGVVVDETITPVAEATIVLELGAQDTQETTSDEQGRFGFSKVPPGTYFLTATAPIHTEVQFSATVEAGVPKPDIINVQLQRIYPGDPFVDPIKADGFFQCSQGAMPGYTYGSSPCHSQGVVDLDDYGVELDQERTFHADIQAGWQTMVFEMTWEPSAQGTSDQMGMVVSTYKPERNTNHWFANWESPSPMRFQVDAGVAHDTSQEGSGPSAAVPEEGIEQMSYFTSVRPPADAVCALWCVPPGLAIDQSFTTYLHVFYYQPAPAEWSIIAGHEVPF